MIVFIVRLKRGCMNEIRENLNENGLCNNKVITITFISIIIILTVSLNRSRSPK